MSTSRRPKPTSRTTETTEDSFRFDWYLDTLTEDQKTKEIPASVVEGSNDEASATQQQQPTLQGQEQEPNKHACKQSKSNLSVTARVGYLRTEDTSVTLMDVPGIGPTTAQKLAAQGIHTPVQLHGYVLQCFGPNITTSQVVNMLRTWFRETVGCQHKHVASIIEIVLEKLNIKYPNLVDEDELVQTLYACSNDDGDAKLKSLDESKTEE